MVVCMSMTRDGYKNPSRRVPDKHTRLFHGRTLDEWFCISCWASKEIDLAVLVCENPEHVERLQPLVDQYGVKLLSRPADMESDPMCDSGGYPMNWGLEELQKSLFITVLCWTYVVNPVRPPEIWDLIIQDFRRRASNPDFVKGPLVEISGTPTDLTFLWYDKESGRARAMVSEREAYINIGTFAVATPRWKVAWEHFAQLGMPGAKPYEPWLYPVDPWTKVHIDEEWEWDLAEYWFGHHIGEGDEAYKAYVDYRESWEC